MMRIIFSFCIIISFVFNSCKDSRSEKDQVDQDYKFKLDEFLDSDRDGFPDKVELDSEEDRNSFRKWFITIAISQYYVIDDRWVDRDCAGLIRFCYKEALRKHDSLWYSQKKFLFDYNIPDVKKINYPNIPLIKDRLFRINSNPFKISDTIENDSIFVSFAEAKYLKEHNFIFISKNISEASPGDVLFFINDVSTKWPFHSMIYVGSDEIGKFEKKNDEVVYHTGPDGKRSGIVKKLTIKDLSRHPNKRWHPSISNPYFLGFFRWKILNN